MNATETVVDALAVARIVRLIQEDDIPFGALRERLLRRYGHLTITELLVCPWCASVHVAVGVAALRWRFPKAWPVLARILAASHVTGFLAART